MMSLILLFGISGGEILVIMLLVLLLFGPSKIPEIARMIGRGMSEVKKVQREINTEIQRYSADVEKEAQKIQSDIQDLKKTIEDSDTIGLDSKAGTDKNAGADNNAGADKVESAQDDSDHETPAKADTADRSPYDYDYDQYGLDDEYGKTEKHKTPDTSTSKASPGDSGKKDVPGDDPASKESSKEGGSKAS